MTDTPEKIEESTPVKDCKRGLQKKLTVKQFLKGGKKKSRQQRIEEESSSDETDTAVVLNDCTGDESPGESSDEDLTALTVGDFAVLRFASKAKVSHNTGLREVVDELEARFLKRGRVCPVHNRPTFTIKSVGEGTFPTEDVMKRLSKPITAGGTARWEKLLIFPCSLKKQNVE